MSYCDICDSCLNEDTSSGQLKFICDICSFSRLALPEETLRSTLPMSNSIKSDIKISDIINDNINARIQIDCKCGGKIGVIYITDTMLTIKICLACQKQLI